MTITINSEPVDDLGYLVHAEDATAQLCLALIRLDAALHGAGLDLSAVSRLRVLTVDARLAGELVEVVAERVGDTTTAVSCVEAPRLPLEGMLVALSADVPALTRTTS